MARTPIGDKPMTPAERKRRQREREKPVKAKPPAEQPLPVDWFRVAEHLVELSEQAAKESVRAYSEVEFGIASQEERIKARHRGLRHGIVSDVLNSFAHALDKGMLALKDKNR